MGRNLPGTRNYSVPRAVRDRPGREVTLPRELWARIDARAEAEGVPRSDLMERAALLYLSLAPDAAEVVSEKSTDP